jgi:hypothetical protein
MWQEVLHSGVELATSLGVKILKLDIDFVFDY